MTSLTQEEAQDLAKDVLGPDGIAFKWKLTTYDRAGGAWKYEAFCIGRKVPKKFLFFRRMGKEVIGSHTNSWEDAIFSTIQKIDEHVKNIKKEQQRLANLREDISKWLEAHPHEYGRRYRP